MIINNRIIYSDNGVMKEISSELNNYRSADYTLPIVAAQDYIFLGSDLPFNHRFFDVKTANTNASVVSVDLWDGNAWVPAVDVRDYTTAAGKTFATSGVIAWTKGKQKQWVQADTENVTGLTSLTIYNLYWARMKFSADLSLTTALSAVWQRFSSDSDLAGTYPELTIANTLAQWPVQPKTNWNEQAYDAASIIIRDLKRKSAITSNAQFLNWEVFTEASIHKTAEIIMNSFGKDWEENRARAAAYYTAAMDLLTFDVDTNGNTILDKDETAPSASVVRR